MPRDGSSSSHCTYVRDTFRSNKGLPSNITTTYQFEKLHWDCRPGAFFHVFFCFSVRAFTLSGERPYLYLTIRRQSPPQPKKWLTWVYFTLFQFRTQLFCWNYRQKKSRLFKPGKSLFCNTVFSVQSEKSKISTPAYLHFSHDILHGSPRPHKVAKCKVSLLPRIIVLFPPGPTCIVLWSNFLPEFSVLFF